MREAIDEIRSSNLPQSIRDAALENLRLQTFSTNTVGAGAARNSTVVRFVNGVAQKP